MWPRLILAVALACALAPAAARETRENKPDSPTAETIRALKRGGYARFATIAPGDWPRLAARSHR
jgi:hypothetical protein